MSHFKIVALQKLAGEILIQADYNDFHSHINSLRPLIHLSFSI
jgi:hypothetical protein